MSRIAFRAIRATLRGLHERGVLTIDDARHVARAVQREAADGDPAEAGGLQHLAAGIASDFGAEAGPRIIAPPAQE